MRDETKVGIFVLVGMALFGTAIFLLGDYSFQTYYPIYAEFKDVAGLPDKSVAKLSGVEVGKIKRIYLKGGMVMVEINVLEGVEIYRDSKFLVGSTSLIGSKFLQIDQGSASAGVLKAGDHVHGSETLPIDRAMAKAVEDIQGLVKDLRGEGSMAKNLNDILSNLREVTANINEIVSTSQPHAEKAMERLDTITAKLDAMLAKTDELVDKINRGEGTVGALVSDKQMKDNVTTTLTNLKEASVSVKEMLGRVDEFRTYWGWQWKYDPVAHNSKSDVGVRIYPRAGRYYYLGAANVINIRDRTSAPDYEVRNSIDAQLGWERGGMDFYAGALHGAGGFGFRWAPFRISGLDRLRLLFEASEFTRRRYIQTRYFNSPRYDAGVDYSVNKYFSAGLKLTDMAEAPRVNYTTRVMFEDKDIAYLLGLMSFGARTGSSSKSSK